MPQVKTKYGLFIYLKQRIVLAKTTRGKGGITTTEYKKLNTKSYKNIIWLDRMFVRKTEAGKKDIFKVIIPLEFPPKYKLYDQNEEFYGTIIDKDNVFIYAVPKNKTKVERFLEKSLTEHYIKAAAGKAGLKVPLEFVKDFERD